MLAGLGFILICSTVPARVQRVSCIIVVSQYGCMVYGVPRVVAFLAKGLPRLNKLPVTVLYCSLAREKGLATRDYVLYKEGLYYLWYVHVDRKQLVRCGRLVLFLSTSVF